MANIRASINHDGEGIVKVLTDTTTTDKILEVHIICPFASKMIAESVLCMDYGAAAEYAVRTFRVHPTFF
jgi:pyruvate/2-oxoglutarate dehydrogenase complex dihydrolipoamide dehydrogenase (E3) component